MKDLERRAEKKRTLRGKPVRNRRDLQPYMGADPYPEPVCSWKAHSCNEPGAVTEVMLCAETAEYIYSRFTPTQVVYKKGSRPVLEGLLYSVIPHGRSLPRSKRERTLMIWDWIFDNVCRRIHPASPVFRYFGTEEDIAALRCRTDCYLSSKLLVTLLQIAGIPARLVHMLHADISSMHTAAEAFLDKGWRFLDQNCHDYAVTETGEMASFWEIVTTPFCQTHGIREDCRKLTAIRNPGRFECISIQNYPVAVATAHYQRQDHSTWWRDMNLADKTCRFGF